MDGSLKQTQDNLKKIVIMPVFNEEMCVENILGYLEDKVDFIIVIDDCSTDSSWERIVNFSKNNSKVVYYRVTQNQGKARIVKLGFQIVQFMLEKGFIHENDLVFNIDSDGQHRLQDIEKLSDLLVRQGYEFVLTRRLFRTYPRLRRWGNYFLSLYASILSGFRYHDSESGFRCMRAYLVKSILEYYVGFHYSDCQETDIIVARLGFKINNNYVSEAIYYRPNGAAYNEGFFILAMAFFVFLKVMFRKSKRASASVLLDKTIQGLVLAQLESSPSKSNFKKTSPQHTVVMLIYPPGAKYIREDRCQVPVKGMVAASLRDPIDLASIAASLNSQFRCIIRDYPAEGKDSIDFVRDLHYFNPRYIIIQFTYPTFYSDIKACQLAKAVIPDVEIIGKGPCFLWQADRTLREYDCLDVAVVGEAEEIIREIIFGKPRREIDGIVFRENGEVFVNRKREFIEDLDTIPFPDRSLIKNELYCRPDTGASQTVIHLERGCPHQCTFCQVGVVSGHKVRYRSVDKTIEEIEECVNKYKINNFFLKSDSFTIDKSWVLNFCQQVKQRNLKISWLSNSRVDDLNDEELIVAMKKAGCRGLALGIESSNQTILDKINKGIKKEEVKRAISLCKKYDLQLLAMFIIGWPWDTKESIEETIQFAKELNTTVAEFNFLVTFPGTILFDECRKKDLINEKDIYQFDYSTRGIRTLYLSYRQLVWLRRKAYLIYYLRLRYFRENILPNIKSFRDFLRFCIYGIQKLSSLF